MEDYRIIEKNGIKMIDITAISSTGIAEAYCTTRDGGISDGVCGSMNCNLYKSLDVESGRENFRIFCTAIDISPEKVITNRLNKFTDICRCVTSDDLIDIYDEPSAPVADGIITQSDDIAIFMYNADCAVILLLDTEKRAIGALHTGWKGSLNKIIPNTVTAMKEKFGTNTKDVIAVICPSICGDCFEVGNEVAKKFTQHGFEDHVYTKDGKPHVDLFAVNRKVLADCGILKEHIRSIELCTCHNPDLFHSYRRGPVSENGTHLNGTNGIFIKLN